MKGLALETIVALVIAVAGVMVFLSLTDYFSIASNWFYCNVYLKIRGFFVGQELASMPEVCKRYVKLPAKIENIKEGDNKRFSRLLLSYIIACWKEAEIKGLYETHPCYELHLLSSVDNVTEQNVSDILIREDHCRSIENSDYGCGIKNQIVWDVDGNVSDSLSPKNVSDAINSQGIDRSIVNESMFTLNNVDRKIKLKNSLFSEIPQRICKYHGKNCYYWESKKVVGNVTLNISLLNYTYNVDLVLSYLEKKGLINSTITTQNILLIEYNGEKDAVEVIG
jgi:hypothetical protein